MESAQSAAKTMKRRALASNWGEPITASDSGAAKREKASGQEWTQDEIDAYWDFVASVPRILFLLILIGPRRVMKGATNELEIHLILLGGLFCC